MNEILQLDDMKNMTQSAQDALSEMASQDYRQRLCLWIVIFALLALNITVLIIMFNNDGKLYYVSNDDNKVGLGYHRRYSSETGASDSLSSKHFPVTIGETEEGPLQDIADQDTYKRRQKRKKETVERSAIPGF